MKKSILILLVALGICKPAAGQYVSVELAVSWQKGDFTFKGEKNSYCYPSLGITYRNSSPQPLYFLKVLHLFRAHKTPASQLTSRSFVFYLNAY